MRADQHTGTHKQQAVAGRALGRGKHTSAPSSGATEPRAAEARRVVTEGMVQEQENMRRKQETAQHKSAPDAQSPRDAGRKRLEMNTESYHLIEVCD